MAEVQPTLDGLAAKIGELSGTLSRYLAEQNIPAPTFAADSPTSYSGRLSVEIFNIRYLLLDALQDMQYLVQGPSESISDYVHGVSTPPVRLRKPPPNTPHSPFPTPQPSTS